MIYFIVAQPDGGVKRIIVRIPKVFCKKICRIS